MLRCIFTYNCDRRLSSHQRLSFQSQMVSLLRVPRAKHIHQKANLTSFEKCCNYQRDGKHMFGAHRINHTVHPDFLNHLATAAAIAFNTDEIAESAMLGRVGHSKKRPLWEIKLPATGSHCLWK